MDGAVGVGSPVPGAGVGIVGAVSVPPGVVVAPGVVAVGSTGAGVTGVEGVVAGAWATGVPAGAGRRRVGEGGVAGGCSAGDEHGRQARDRADGAPAGRAPRRPGAAEPHSRHQS